MKYILQDNSVDAETHDVDDYNHQRRVFLRQLNCPANAKKTFNGDFLRFTWHALVVENAFN